MTNRTLNASIAGIIGFFVAAIATYLILSIIVWDIQWAADNRNTDVSVFGRFLWMMASTCTGALAAFHEYKRK